MREAKAQCVRLQQLVDGLEGDPDEKLAQLEDLAVQLKTLTYTVEKARDAALADLAALTKITDLSSMSSHDLEMQQAAIRVELRGRQNRGSSRRDG